MRIFKWLYQRLQLLLDQMILFGAKSGAIRRYQPLYNYSNIRADRTSQDRWEKMTAVLPKTPFSLLDVGSQFGFFTLSAARAGGVCLGIERVWHYRAVAAALARRNDLSNATFLQMEINQKSVQGLPRTDVLFCLSVFHHWVLDWGYPTADEIFSRLCENINLLIFETGQATEIDQPFADKLEFMKPTDKTWIENYLKSKGFTNIRHLGEFSTHLGPYPRHLYCAEKPR